MLLGLIRFCHSAYLHLIRPYFVQFCKLLHNLIDSYVLFVVALSLYFVVCFVCCVLPITVSNRVAIHDLTCYRWTVEKKTHKGNFIYFFSLVLSFPFSVSFFVWLLYKFRIYYNNNYNYNYVFVQCTHIKVYMHR